MTNCLIFDLGAGSGRAVLADYDGERISLSEIHRFSGMDVRLQDGPHWDFNRLLTEVEVGLSLAVKRCGTLDSVGVDSWGLDYALVREDGSLEPYPHHYRHPRAQSGFDHFPLAPETMFKLSGAQILPINTVYQPCGALEKNRAAFDGCKHALMIADAVNYHLTGTARSNASLMRISGLLSSDGTLNHAMAETADLSLDLFPPLIEGGTVLGLITAELQTIIGAVNAIPVVAVAAHDTASAVCGLPLQPNETFLICGSWSIIGREIEFPLLSHDAYANHFGNEGGGGRAKSFSSKLEGSSSPAKASGCMERALLHAA